MSMADIHQAMVLVESAEWNQTADDWKMLLNLPGENLLVEDNNEVIASISAIDYSSFVWIAMVLVHPAYRRKGIATYMMESVLEKYRNKTIRLDATPAGAKVYEGFSFKPVDHLIRWKYCPLKRQANYSSPSRNLDSIDLKKIEIIDHKIFGTDRSMLLRWLFNKYPERSFYFGQNYVFGRPGRKASQIGPLIAATDENAVELVMQQLQSFPNDNFYLDSFDHKAWHKQLEELGFEKERDFIRMQKGSDMNFGNSKFQYAIGGPELA